MPSYNLTAPQVAICVDWLYGPGGYLDTAKLINGQTAHQALIATPTLDVTVWCRTNLAQKDPSVDLTDWTGCSMVWWIRAHDQVNIRPQDRPPESASWIALLNTWDSSLVQHPGDTTPVRLFEIDGVTTFTQPANANRVAQRGIISGALSVLS